MIPISLKALHPTRHLIPFSHPSRYLILLFSSIQALDKIRFASLTDSEALGDTHDLEIRVGGGGMIRVSLRSKTRKLSIFSRDFSIRSGYDFAMLIKQD